jgi:hypothetical protein
MSLETLLEKKKEERPVKHFDPLEAVSHHVVLVIFFAVLFLFSLSMFLMAEPDEEFMTTYAIFEWGPVTWPSDAWHAVTGFFDAARTSVNHSYILLTLYALAIVVYMAVNLVLYERRK